MEPYEKLFSPKRVVRKSSRLREKHINEEDDQGGSKKVKEERGEGAEGKEENGVALYNYVLVALFTAPLTLSFPPPPSLSHFCSLLPLPYTCRR